MFDAASKMVFAKDDSAMQRAFASARESFRYFWREIAWDKRRIVQGMEFAHVKAAFCDGGELEYMWLSEIEFDGQYVSGVLVNAPRYVDARKGDPVATEKDARGWTLLHDEALAGNVETVKVLLGAGADRTAVTGNGMTPAQLAATLGWTKVVALLDG